MIYVECNPDETLVRVLSFSRKQVVHAFGKGNICNRLERTEGVIGLMDEDPRSAQPNYLQRLRLQEQKEGIKILRDNKRRNFVVMLCPKLEDWVIQAAKKDKLDLAKYQLPDNAKKLHGKINLQSKHFEKFLIEALPVSNYLKNLQRILKHIYQIS